MNTLPGPISRVEQMSLKGPQLVSRVWSEKFQQYVTQLEQAVVNSDEPVVAQYGNVLLEWHNEGNANQSKLRAHFVDNETYGAVGTPVFNTRTDKSKEDTNMTQQLLPFVIDSKIEKVVVPAGTAPDSLTDTILSSQVAYVDHAHAEKTNIKSTSFRSRADIDNEAALGELMPFCQIVNKTSSIVPTGTNPDAIVFKKLASYVVDISSFYAKKTTYVVDNFISIDELIEIDEGVKGLMTQTVVAVGTAVDTGSDIFWSFVKKVDEAHAIKTTLSGRDAAQNLVSHTTKEYEMPSLLSWASGALEAIFVANQERTYFKVNPTIDRGYVTAAQAKITTSYITGTGTVPALFEFRTKDIRFSGMLFDVNVPNVLCDATTLTATTHSDDAYWDGSAVESFSYPDSTPSRSAWLSTYVGTWRTVSYICAPWRYGLHKEQTIEILMK